MAEEVIGELVDWWIGELVNCAQLTQGRLLLEFTDTVQFTNSQIHKFTNCTYDT